MKISGKHDEETLVHPLNKGLLGGIYHEKA